MPNRIWCYNDINMWYNLLHCIGERDMNLLWWMSHARIIALFEKQCDLQKHWVLRCYQCWYYNIKVYKGKGIINR